MVLLHSLNPVEVRTAVQREVETITRWKAALMTPSEPARGKAVILHKYTRTDGGFAGALKIAKAWLVFAPLCIVVDVSNPSVVVVGIRTFSPSSDAPRPVRWMRHIS